MAPTDKNHDPAALLVIRLLNLNAFFLVGFSAVLATSQPGSAAWWLIDFVKTIRVFSDTTPTELLVI